MSAIPCPASATPDGVSLPLTVVQASLSDCVSFDPLTFEQDGLAASEVHVGRGEIVEALVVSSMIVMLDDGQKHASADLGIHFVNRA